MKNVLSVLVAAIMFFSVSCTKDYSSPANPVNHINAALADTAKVSYHYFPCAATWGTLAFEDNWPKAGDQDFNDLVVNYKYTLVSNSSNDLVEMRCDFVILAAGASYHNGLGVAFPFSAASVKSVTGQKLISSYIQLNANGTEAGQKNAVIIPFDNHEALIKYFDGSYFINTIPGKEKIKSDTAHIVIKFAAKISVASINSSSFNPFLISNLSRGTEIHLPGNKPTDKANISLFNTDDDHSNIATGNTYVSKDSLPWALNFAKPFAYPVERASIENAYLHYLDWLKSGGLSYTDWYTNTSATYRDTANIFN